MKGFRLFQKITGSIIGSAGLLYGGYIYGSYNTVKKLEKPEGWQNLSNQSRYRPFTAAVQKVAWNELEPGQVRKLLPSILDAAKVPHGDMVCRSAYFKK